MARGDRVRVKRRLGGLPISYMHHGIDVGDGTVIHSRPDDPQRLFAGGRIVRTTIEEFAAGEEVGIVAAPPAVYQPDEIVARAYEQIGREGYCPVVDNCEHFTTWCATGERSSRQIDLLLERVGAGVAAMAAVFVATSVATQVARHAGRSVAAGWLTAVRRVRPV